MASQLYTSAREQGFYTLFFSIIREAHIFAASFFRRTFHFLPFTVILYIKFNEEAAFRLTRGVMFMKKEFSSIHTQDGPVGVKPAELSR